MWDKTELKVPGENKLTLLEKILAVVIGIVIVVGACIKFGII